MDSQSNHAARISTSIYSTGRCGFLDVSTISSQASFPQTITEFDHQQERQRLYKPGTSGNHESILKTKVLDPRGNTVRLVSLEAR